MKEGRKKDGTFQKGFRPASWRHGMSKTRFWATFLNVKRRCENPSVSSYPRYGGRGIKCLWESFESFRDDMYESYLAHVAKYGEEETTIERIDVNGNYCKENCRWATWEEQAGNKRNNKLITFRGETAHVREWARKTGIAFDVLYQRLNRYGWSVERALTSPIGPTSKRYGNN